MPSGDRDRHTWRCEAPADQPRSPLAAMVATIAAGCSPSASPTRLVRARRRRRSRRRHRRHRRRPWPSLRDAHGPAARLRRRPPSPSRRRRRARPRPPSGLIALADLPVPPARIPVLYYHRSSRCPPTSPPVEGEAADVPDLRHAAEGLRGPARLAARPRLHDDPAARPRGPLGRPTPLPARPVIITFDDGSRDWVTRVMPMLKKRGMVAEFYLTLDAIERRQPHLGRGPAARRGRQRDRRPRRPPLPADRVRHRPQVGVAKVMWDEVNGVRQTIGAKVGIYPDSMAYVGGGYDAHPPAARRAGRLHAGPRHQPRCRPDRGPPVRDADRPGRRPRRRQSTGDGHLVPGLPTFAGSDGRRLRQGPLTTVRTCRVSRPGPRRRSRAGGPIRAIRPASMTATSSAKSWASSGSWVTTMP